MCCSLVAMQSSRSQLTNDLTQRLDPTFVTLLRGANVNFLSGGGYHKLAFTGCFHLGLPCSVTRLLLFLMHLFK